MRSALVVILAGFLSCQSAPIERRELITVVPPPPPLAAAEKSGTVERALETMCDTYFVQRKEAMQKAMLVTIAAHELPLYPFERAEVQQELLTGFTALSKTDEFMQSYAPYGDASMYVTSENIDKVYLALPDVSKNIDEGYRAIRRAERILERALAPQPEFKES